MNLMRIREYSAWICIEGQATNMHNVEQTQNAASCWIASDVGKRFSVNWYNETRDIPLQAVILIDGLVCDSHIMLDARRFPDKPNGVGVSYARTSDWTRRDFQFSSILISDDDAYLDTVDASLNIGTITLQLWRLEVNNVVSQRLKHRYGGEVLENQVVHEKSKKAGAHHVTFGEEYASASPTVDMVQGRTLDKEPFITFAFKYRPREILIANGIISCPTASTSAHTEEQTAIEIKKLEARLKELRDKDGASGGRPRDRAPSASTGRRIKREPKSLRVPSTSVRMAPEIIDLTHL